MVYVLLCHPKQEKTDQHLLGEVKKIGQISHNLGKGDEVTFGTQCPSKHENYGRLNQITLASGSKFARSCNFDTLS